MIPTVILISHCLLLSNSKLCNLLCQGSVRTMETFAFTGSLFVIYLVRPFPSSKCVVECSVVFYCVNDSFCPRFPDK